MSKFPDFLISIGDYAEYLLDIEVQLPFFLRQLADFAYEEEFERELELKAAEQAILDVSLSFFMI